MLAPSYSADDYTGALQAHLPRGRVWPRDADADITKILRGLAPSSATLNARANQLLIDSNPSSTVELLPEWEATLGLPDPCAGPSPTIELRRAQVLARFIGDGGQSVDYYVGFAATLGYAITITEFAPFYCGDTFGRPLLGIDWAFAWQVNGPTYTVERFQCGISTFGEPLAFWTNDVLQCELQRLAPAHTSVLFSYT